MMIKTKEQNGEWLHNRRIGEISDFMAKMTEAYDQNKIDFLTYDTAQYLSDNFVRSGGFGLRHTGNSEMPTTDKIG